MPLAPQTRAAFTMLLAVAAFALMDAGLKQLAATYPPMQVAALRGAASLPFILVWVVAILAAVVLLFIYEAARKK